MAEGIPAASPFPTTVQKLEKTQTTAWYVWCSAIAVTATTAGLFWDISWHMSIGRDTFWTPAHLAIHFGALVAGLSSAYLILSTTFGKNAVRRASSVKLWGFYGPLGAFVSLWGGLTMLTSAPFDNWWHNAFGLDVQILSPPHAVLFLGIFTVGLGGLILIVAEMNRASEEARAKLNWVFLYAGCMLTLLLLMLIWEYTDQNLMHSAIFYRAVALAVPPILVGIARASGYRWAATKVTVIYFLLWLLTLWLLPLVPAEAKLGPVYTRITHLVPLRFPLLLFAGAAALDYLLDKTAPRNKWLQAVVAGTGFLAALVLVQWPMGSFLISPRAENWVFGTDYYPYMMPPSAYKFAHSFQRYETTPAQFWIGMTYALVAAILTTRIGLAWGSWMHRIKR
jgi:uncharacterized integral membrane protein